MVERSFPERTSKRCKTGWVQKTSLGRPLFHTNPFYKITHGAEKMKIERKFTKAGQDAYAGINFVTTTSEIRNPDGTIVFKLDDVEVPDSWSQVASDVIAQKYFRKAGVPTKTKK